jgi:hypothetical protein
MTTTQELERAAVDAHRRGLPWSQFWPTVAADVIRVEPYDRNRYHKLVGRLVALVAAGDVDGAEPADDGWPRPMPWELDDAPAPALVVSDSETRARVDWSAVGLGPVIHTRLEQLNRTPGNERNAANGAANLTVNRSNRP